jgi:hypothetical protein
MFLEKKMLKSEFTIMPYQKSACTAMGLLGGQKSKSTKVAENIRAKI